MSSLPGPFFYYYGAKWAAFKRYPAPLHETIVEPFAGSAAYACRYPDRKVRLYDKDEIVASVWDYLIGVSASEMMALPLIFDHVDDLDVPQEARWLIGFWLNHATTSPRKTPSGRMRSGYRPNSYWGESLRARLAGQVEAIRHWTVTCASYETAGDDLATWFIDPPYSTPGGRHYRHHDVDYGALGDWCKEREGQVIVCEQQGADWLPFESIGSFKSMRGSTAEVAYLA